MWAMHIQSLLYSVDVIVKRVGGAYGAKITRCHQIAAACGLAAYVSRRWALLGLVGTAAVIIFVYAHLVSKPHHVM